MAAFYGVLGEVASIAQDRPHGPAKHSLPRHYGAFPSSLFPSAIDSTKTA
jgi:hypothetical protein